MFFPDNIVEEMDDVANGFLYYNQFSYKIYWRLCNHLPCCLQYLTSLPFITFSSYLINFFVIKLFVISVKIVCAGNCCNHVARRAPGIFRLHLIIASSPSITRYTTVLQLQTLFSPRNIFYL